MHSTHVVYQARYALTISPMSNSLFVHSHITYMKVTGGWIVDCLAEDEVCWKEQ